METNINKPTQLDLIHDIIHDCWFSVSDINFDESESKLSIKFEGKDIEKQIIKKIFVFKKVELVSYESYLIINHVQNYSIKDTERVGKYDFNILKFEDNKNEITIETGVPIEIKAIVNQFEIDVCETKNIASNKTTWTV